MKNRCIIIIKGILLLLFTGVLCLSRGQNQVRAENETLGIAVFDVDATPPVAQDESLLHAPLT